VSEKKDSVPREQSPQSPETRQEQAPVGIDPKTWEAVGKHVDWAQDAASKLIDEAK